MFALLINPVSGSLVGKKGKFHRRFPPLCLLNIASILRLDGWKVAVRDLNANPNITSDSVRKESFSADLVIFTTNPYADWQCPSYAIESILDYAKSLETKGLVIIGNHGTHYPGSILRDTNALAVIRGEPEEAALEVARVIASKDLNVDLKAISGISYRIKGKNFHNAERRLPVLDDLPAPAYDLIDLKDYFYELLGGQFAICESSRGCPYSCNFCNLSMFQKKFRKRSPEKVLKEIDDLINLYGCRSLYIFDLEFAINENMVERIATHLIEKNYRNLGFRWACQTRADSINEKLAKLMKQSGCDLIHFGVEAGNEEILRATNKRINKESIQKGIRSTHDAGIRSAAFFIFGHPNETVKEYRETLQFALKLNPNYASFHPLVPFPGSPLFESKFGKGPYWEEPFNLESYFTKGHEKWLAGYIRRAFLRFYLRPRYLWRLIISGSLHLRQLRLFFAFLRA